MCISTGPAHFSKTKILTMPVGNRHFTSYQNDAINKGKQPNALILPIPGTTKPEYFVNTSEYNKFLEEIVENRKPKTRSLSLSKSLKSFESFELGQYTVGLVKNLTGMLDFLKSVDESKRAKINPELLNFFAEHYEGWSFAICLFNSADTMKSQPIAYFYEPFYSNVLFFPTMDSHDGFAPKMQNEEFDHDFIYSLDNDETSDFFTQKVPDFIKNNSYSVLPFHNRYYSNSNGDCFVDIKNKEFSKLYNFAKTFKLLKESENPHQTAYL